MLIRLGYDIEFSVPNPVAVVALLNVHPSRVPDLREPDELRVEPSVKIENYLDHFGNRCARFLAPAGKLRLHNSTLIEDSGLPDPIEAGARQQAVDELPSEVLVYLLTAGIAKSTGCPTSPPIYSAARSRAGAACGRSLIGSTIKWNSDITTRGPPEPRSMFTLNASASAAIFSIWPSLFAAA